MPISPVVSAVRRLRLVVSELEHSGGAVRRATQVLMTKKAFYWSHKRMVSVILFLTMRRNGEVMDN